MVFIELILELLGYLVFDFLLFGIVKLMRGIGSLVLSIFSLFKVSPKEHYHTESYDKKIGLFWLGLIVFIILIWLIFKVIY